MTETRRCRRVSQQGQSRPRLSHPVKKSFEACLRSLTGSQSRPVEARPVVKVFRNRTQKIQDIIAEHAMRCRCSRKQKNKLKQSQHALIRFLLAVSAGLVDKQLVGWVAVRVDGWVSSHPLEVVEIHVRADVPIHNYLADHPVDF